MAGTPEMSHGYLGPQPKFEEFGLSAVSHPNPEISSDTNQLEIQIKFSKPTKMTATLTQCSKSVELPQHVFTQTKCDIISFATSLPEAGYYKLQLFALLLPDDSKSLPGVFNYLIYCTKVTTPVLVYPKQFAQWKEGCYIIEPLSLSMGSGLSNVRFEAYLPNVRSVAVVVDGNWTHLNRNDQGLWEGRVGLETYAKDTKVTLNANYGDDMTFSTLLEYKL